MANFKPSAPFNVAMKLLVPTWNKVQGVAKKSYPAPDEVTEVFFGSFRTFGGTERIVNDLFTIEDTATIDTWYDPAFTADCLIYICETGQSYEILGTPEDIDMRHQYLSFKVKRKGGAA